MSRATAARPPGLGPSPSTNRSCKGRIAVFSSSPCLSSSGQSAPSEALLGNAGPSTGSTMDEHSPNLRWKRTKFASITRLPGDEVWIIMR